MQDMLQNLLLLLIISALAITNAVSIGDNSERFQETRCNFIDRTNVLREMQNTKCKPRQTHVVIEIAKNNLILHGNQRLRRRWLYVNMSNVYPPAVMVKRCNGYCARHKSCLPVVKRMVTKPVQYWNPMEPRNSHMCGTIEVEEHVSCKCECAVKENDCSELQIYDEHNCICACNNKEAMEACKLRQQGWRWDHEKCVCVM